MYDPMEGWDEAMCWASGQAAILAGGIFGPPEQISVTEFSGGSFLSTIEAIEGWFETAVCLNGGSEDYSVHPVERYATKQDALRGHVVWAALIPTLNEITDIGYGALTPAKQVSIKEAVSNA